MSSFFFPSDADDAPQSAGLLKGLADPSSQAESAPLGQTMPDVGKRLDERPRFAFLSAARSPDEMGWLGPYRIRGVLGEGGMGVVFDAEDSLLCRRVALKILKPELAQTPVVRERFLQEARAAAALPPEHVVAIYQVGSEGDVPYLAMQYLDGESLEHYLRRLGRLSAMETARLGRDIALGLSVAHEKGLIHRDIKPANIWLEAVPGSVNPRVKLLDFGLARMAGGVSNLTASGMIVGTPHYMAPEQARGLALDHRCDLFSLGCVLYRALTGVPPFDGPDLYSVLSSLAVDEPRPIQEGAPDAPVELSALIQKLLAKSPSDRPSTARGVAERLRHFLGTPTLSFHSPLPSLDPITDSRSKSISQRSGRNRFGTGLVFGGLLALLVFVLGAWGWIKMGMRPASPNIDCSLQGHPIPVGVLQSLSGPLASTSSSIIEATKLAIDEINERGGVLGSRVEPIFADCSSDESAFAEQGNRLIMENHACALFGCCSSAGRKRILPIVEKHSHLLFYPLASEGLEQSPNVIYVGAASNQQVVPALRFVTGTLRKRRLFFVGSDNVYSRTTHAVLADALAEAGDVRIVGETFFPRGSSDFKDAAARITDSKADAIFNTIGGDGNVAFFHALRAAGITPKSTPTLSFALGEHELRTLPVDQIQGDYAAWSFFPSANRPENTAFVNEFRKRYGEHRVVTDAMESAYVAVHLWARAATEAGDTQPTAVRSALHGLQINGPGGPMRIDADNQYAWKVMRVAQIGARGQFHIVWSSEEPMPPQPFPPSRKREQWTGFLTRLQHDWGGRWER